MDDEQRETDERAETDVRLDPQFAKWLGEQDDGSGFTVEQHRHALKREANLGRGSEFDRMVKNVLLDIKDDFGLEPIPMWKLHRITFVAEDEVAPAKNPRREAEWALCLSQLVFGRRRRERVFEPIVSDMRLEIDEAEKDGRIAVAFAWLRGLFSLLRAAGCWRAAGWLIRYHVLRHII